MTVESFEERVRNLTQLLKENRITEAEYRSLLDLALTSGTSFGNAGSTESYLGLPIELIAKDNQPHNQATATTRPVFTSMVVVAISLFLICAAWGAFLPYSTNDPNSDGKLNCSAPIIEVFAKGERNSFCGRGILEGRGPFRPSIQKSIDEIAETEYWPNYCRSSAFSHLYVVALAAVLCLAGIGLATLFDNSRKKGS